MRVSALLSGWRPGKKPNVLCYVCPAQLAHAFKSQTGALKAVSGLNVLADYHRAFDARHSHRLNFRVAQGTACERNCHKNI
jgi:hypothetical protein